MTSRNDTYVGSAKRRLCPDGHDPALATGVCTRCGYDLYGYYDDVLDPATRRLVPRRCSHDGHLTHRKGRYGTYADGRDAEPCTTINDWGQ